MLIPTVVYSFFMIFQPENANRIYLNYSVLIVTYVLSYISVHINFKFIDKNKKIIKYLHNLILCNLFFIATWLSLLVNIENANKWSSILLK